MAQAINASTDNREAFKAILAQAGVHTPLRTDNVIASPEKMKKILEVLGYQPTSEDVETCLQGMKDARSRVERSVLKGIQRENKKAEQKGELPNTEDIAKKVLLKKTSVKATEIRQQSLEEHCLTCDISGLDLLKQNKTLKKCSRCKAAMYCSADCQTTNWPTHKSVCKIPTGSKSS